MRSRSIYRTSIPAMVLLCIYLFNPIKLYMPYLDYQVNYNYIVSFLCENKDKPKVHCNGKCFLSKALKNQEKGQTHQKISHKNFYADEVPVEKTSMESVTEACTEYSTLFILDFISFFAEKYSPPPQYLN